MERSAVLSKQEAPTLIGFEAYPFAGPARVLGLGMAVSSRDFRICPTATTVPARLSRNI